MKHFIIFFLILSCYSISGFYPDQVIAGELASFISYAQAFPNGFLALIDTYDAIK